MYGQACARATRTALVPSVAVRDRGHWKGVAGSAWAGNETGGKVIAPGCASKERTGQPARCPKIISDSISEDSPQGEWDRIAQQMMLTFAESGCPIFCATTPLSRGVLKSKSGRKLSIHFCADQGTIETVFRTIISVNQLSLYGAVDGAVEEMCEECDSCHNGTGRPVVEGQSNPSFVPSVMKTHIPLTDDPAQEEDLLQRYRERIEKLSQQDRVCKF